MRVLLVEDDRRIASDVATALESAGYVVETVSNGEEAWFHGDTEDYAASDRARLRPLAALRDGIADIRSGRNRRLPSTVPVVEEVNALLDTQELEIERSRGRAADLAHGLKTPLAALSADAERLRKRGGRRSCHGYPIRR
jgi:CheY-like chemotaxis protein